MLYSPVDSPEIVILLRVDNTFSPIIEPTYTLNGTPEMVKYVRTLLLASRTFVPSNENTVPFIFTFSFAFNGMYIDVLLDTSVLETVTTLFELASSVDVTFNVNVAEASAVTGVGSTALMSAPVNGVLI